MKYKTLTIALVSVLSVTLTACTLQDLPVIGKYFSKLPSGGTSSSSGTLTVWGLWENPKVMNALIQKFKEKNPKVTITYEDRSVLKPVDYRDRIFTRASQDVGADVIMVHDSWTPRLQANLAPMPASMMDAKTYASTYYPAASAAAVAGGKIYAVPAYYDGLVMLYNKKHFEEVGQQEPPTAWEEFRRLALKLVVRSGDNRLVRAGAAIGNADNIEHFSDIVGLMFAQTNVTIPTDLDTKAAQDAIDFYTTFVKEDKVWDGTLPEATTAFAQEKVSMIFVPSWRILDILAANPGLQFGVAPVPQALPDAPATMGSFWMYAVPKTSKNTTLAWEFINFLSQEDQELLLYNEASKVRPFGPVYARVSLGSQLTSNPYLKAFVDTAPFAKIAELNGRVGDDKITSGMKTAINQILGGGDTATVLKNLKDGKI
jgi:multiple sugar transport system substrate-binding protein